MRCLKTKFMGLAALALIAFFLAPVTVSAQTSTQCECFCGTSDAGADSLGKKSSQSECRSACGKPAKLNNKSVESSMFVGCFLNASDYPENDEKCWTKEECDPEGEWAGSRTPYCSNTTGTDDEMRYCYPENDHKISLNVDIGSMTETGDLGEYVVGVYSWLIPAAALIAVVMMMIGGLQYAMARGKSAYIDKGKKRIANAIAGLVLLMSAYVIVQLIDPRLVSFQALKTPLIKEVTLLDPDASCERLSELKFDIDPPNDDTPQTACAATPKQGTITSMDRVEGNVSSGSWKVGDKCTFQGCMLGFVCAKDIGCASCATIPSPSEATCNAMDIVASDGGFNVLCEYIAEDETCAFVADDRSVGGLSCSSVKTFASNDQEYPGCHFYESLYWYGSSGSRAFWEGAEYDGDTLVSGQIYETVFEDVCNNDLCGVNTGPGKSGCMTQYGVEQSWTSFFQPYVRLYCATNE